MEKKATSKSSKAKVNNSEKLKRAYIEHILEYGSRPASIFKFVKELKIKEEAFYENFNSFDTLEKELWCDWFNETVALIKAEEVYSEYSAREKLLAFYFTFIEVLKSNRSFILLTVKKTIRPEFTPAHLKEFRKEFKEFVNEILNEAKETDEVQNRPYISDKYDEGIWLQFLFVFNFWIKDDSKAFEKTDEAIEKAVNLSFDLMGRGPLDAMIDFGKFLFQNR